MSATDADDPRPCHNDDEVQETEEETNAERPGLPDEATVVSEETITSPKGRRYRVLRTTQTDPYDAPPLAEDERP